MRRALFLYAKLNPGLCYIQGMNELIAPLYFLFKTDSDKGVSRTSLLTTLFHSPARSLILPDDARDTFALDVSVGSAVR
jgi:hypothetical protein